MILFYTLDIFHLNLIINPVPEITKQDVTKPMDLLIVKRLLWTAKWKRVSSGVVKITLGHSFTISWTQDW